MSLEIVVSGADITDDVIIEDAKFTMANGPNPGDFEFRVKDVAKTYEFRAGVPIEVDFDGVRVFEGYVLLASMGHAFPVDDTVTEGPEAVERIWTLKGVDLNILFRKRVIFDQDDPHLVPDLELAAGTSDLTYLNQILDHLTLGGDNLSFDLHHVGTPNPDKKGNALFTGDSWEKVMAQTAALPGAIWGIRPPRTVYYEDDDTETAPFAISDDPNNTTSFGYANFEWLNDGSKLVNDARIWGVGLGQDHLTFGHVSDAASIAEHGRWENGAGWRYNLYRQTSVNIVTNSLVYGSPQNLHGPKDDSKVVTCRIRKPGIMPGHKVRIISTVFDEEMVLPVRRYTISFVDRNHALFDLEMSWDIDAPRSLFDYPPRVRLPSIVIPPPPSPCDPNGPVFWWAEAKGWEMVKSHPYMGIVNAISARQGAQLQPKKRYFQSPGFPFVIAPNDGFDQSLPFVYFRKDISLLGNKWAIRMEFESPYLTMSPGYHKAPFPNVWFTIPVGTQSNDLYPRAAMTVMVNGTVTRLATTNNGTTLVNGQTGHQAQGKRFIFEYNSNGERRIWPSGDARPASANVTAYPTDDPNPQGLPWQEIGVYEPGDPWYRDAFGSNAVDLQDLMYVAFDTYGGYAGDPELFQSFGQNLYSMMHAATGTPAGDIGGPFIYASGIEDSYRVTFQVNYLNFIILPGTFNFSTESIVECPELVVQPIAGAVNCESISKTSDTVYETTWPFAAGSSLVSLEGVEQRLGFDYDEDPVNQKIIFRDPVLSSALLYVCYTMVGSAA